MVKKYIAIVVIALFLFVFIAIPLIDFEQEPEFIEIENQMIFGNSGQGENRDADTGEMVKVVGNG